MLREFETRRPQFDQLTQSAEGILSQTGDSPQDPKDLEEVRSELGSVSRQWEDLTGRLTQRSDHIDRALGTSERYQVSLIGLMVSCCTELHDEALTVLLSCPGPAEGTIHQRRCSE